MINGVAAEGPPGHYPGIRKLWGRRAAPLYNTKRRELRIEFLGTRPAEGRIGLAEVVWLPEGQPDFQKP